MRLWLVWWSVIEPLREVCARQASFLWLALTTAGICARGDLLGVSSIVRTLGLAGRCYDRLLDFVHLRLRRSGSTAGEWKKSSRRS